MSKRNKTVQEDPAGGWRTAMADFCMSMMTLFLVLWIVSITEIEQREALSEYFTEVGDSDIKSKTPFFDPTVRRESPHSPYLREVQRMVGFQEHLRLEETPDGLIVQLIETEDRSMFHLGEYQLKPYFEEILQKLGALIVESGYDIAITGHTDATPFSRGSYLNNWTLSYARANTVREFMDFLDMPASRIRSVSGMADSRLLDETYPRAAINRRVEIMLFFPSGSSYPVEERFVSR